MIDYYQRCKINFIYFEPSISIILISDDYIEPKQIYLIGTSHVSEQSAKDVSRVIETVRPQCVVIELCRARKGVLMQEQQSADSASELGIIDLISQGRANNMQGTVSVLTILRKYLYTLDNLIKLKRKE